jgi:uncharacterized protein (DUF983 family)
MPYRSADNFDDGELTDRELPDRSDMDDDQDDATEPCPHCKRRIYEHSEFCPHCGKYISEEDAPTGRSVWVAIGVGIAILIVIFGWAL